MDNRQWILSFFHYNSYHDANIDISYFFMSPEIKFTHPIIFIQASLSLLIFTLYLIDSDIMELRVVHFFIFQCWSISFQKKTINDVLVKETMIQDYKYNPSGVPSFFL